MDPATLGLIGGLVNAGVGAIGNWLGSSKDDAERRERELALQEYASLAPPKEANLIAREVAGSAASRARADQGQRALQDEVQGRLMDRVRGGGMDLQSRAKLEQARMEAGQHEQEMREGSLQNLRARGVMGGGEELLARLSAGQGAADRERMAGVQTLADADQAALQSLIAGGNMAAGREASDWSQQMGVANAEDDISKFNAGEFNRFQLANAADVRARFNQQLALSDRRAGIHEGNAAIEHRNAQQERQQVGGIGQGLGYGIAAVGSSYQPAQKASAAYTPSQPATVGTAAALQPALTQQQMTDPSKRKAR